jgi:hypothetical protein
LGKIAIPEAVSGLPKSFQVECGFADFLGINIMSLLAIQKMLSKGKSK